MKRRPGKSAITVNGTSGLEQIEVYDDVIFWSFDLNAHAKCNWWKKTATAGIGEKLTIRTAGTARKIAEK